MKFSILASRLLLALPTVACPAAFAQSAAHPLNAGGVDAMAPVYIVTAQETYTHGVKPLARSATTRRDSAGHSLVIAELRNHQLSDVARHVHTNEHRCGGFFAFASKAEAEAFVRSDAAAKAATQRFLADYTIDNQATVNPWLGQVKEDNIYTTIDTLSAYKNRFYASSHGKASAEWIASTWQGLVAGRSDVTVEKVACSGCSTQPNVVLTVRGAEIPDEVVVLGGHLDSINGSQGNNPEQTAPGADDDASGIATLTEVIRVGLANGWKPKRTVKFMGYAAEEIGLVGSNSIARQFKADGVNVVGVLQLDMTNYRTTGAPDMNLITDNSNASLRDFFTRLFDTYLQPRGMRRGAMACGYGCSDHASWTSAGYPAAMMFEGVAGLDSNGNIHSTRDTLASMNESAEASVKFAQFGLAFLGELGKTAGSNPPANLPPTAAFTSTTNGLTASFRDTSTDSDGSIASRRWEFGDGSTSTEANPSRTYAKAGTYAVKLTVTDDDGASASRSNNVTVSDGTPPANKPPVASFTSSVNGLAVAFRDTSTDSDGNIASWRWDFGDGTSATDANPDKTYAKAGTYTVKLTVTDDDGATASSSAQVVTTCQTNCGSELGNGVPVAGLTAARGQSLNYSIQVPAGAKNLRISTSGGSGDADLYVKQGSVPTDASFNCRSLRIGNNETCTIAAPKAGVYHVRLKAYRAFSGVSLVASYTR